MGKQFAGAQRVVVEVTAGVGVGEMLRCATQLPLRIRQKPSRRLALPFRIDFTSVPTSSMPVSRVSRISYWCRAAGCPPASDCGGRAAAAAAFFVLPGHGCGCVFRPYPGLGTLPARRLSPPAPVASHHAALKRWWTPSRHLKRW